MKSQIKMLIKWESKCSLIFFMRATYWPNDLRLGLPRILPTELWFWLPEWAPEPLLQHLPCCVWKEMRKRSSAAASHPPYWWNPAPLPEGWWYDRLMMVIMILWPSVILIVPTVPLIDVCSSSQTSTNTRHLPSFLTLTTVFVFSGLQVDFHVAGPPGKLKSWICISKTTVLTPKIKVSRSR